MAEVKVLWEGYTSDEAQGRACSTVTLVKSGKHRIVCDPGTLPTKQDLLDALSDNGLKPEDVDIVFLTHSHVDHYKNLGMFPKARILDFWGWWDNDKLTGFDGLDDEITIIKTPGHSTDSVTMLVRTPIGTVAICGDVFWKENFPKEDTYAINVTELQQSRKKLLEIADYIVPGHGEMYKI